MNRKGLVAAAISILAIALGMLGGGCSKNDTPSFTWTYGYYTNSADSAYSPAVSSAAPVANSCIDAWANLTYIQIHTNEKLAVGTYPLATNTSGAFLIYYSNGSTENSSSGSVTVTYNDGSKMSGSYKATFAGNNAGSISGSFSNIQIK